MTPVRIHDVARRAGVSVGTVSHVLNRPDRVAEPTRLRVRAAIDELGFVRNASASRLKAARSTAIGLVVVDVGNPFFAAVVRGVETVAEERGFVVLLCNADSSPERERRHLAFLEEQRVAGVLVTPLVSDGTAPRLQALKHRGVAVVLLDEPAPAGDACSVTVDDVLGGELAGRHLLGAGRRRIVYVETRGAFRQFRDRFKGLARSLAIHAAGDEATLEVVQVDSLEPADVGAAVDGVLARRPDAVFCANDIAALSLLQGFTARGVRVPDDVALVGYDDISFAAMATVPLTSVRQPAVELGRTAARLLLDECAPAPTGGDHRAHAHQQIVFRPELIVRQSSSG